MFNKIARPVALLAGLAFILPACTHEDAWEEPQQQQEAQPEDRDFVRTLTCDPNVGIPCDGYDAVPVFWPRLTVGYYINEFGSSYLHPDDDTISPELERDIVASFDTWNEPECSDFFLEYKGTTPFRGQWIDGNSASNINVFVFEDEVWPYGRAVALTTLTYRKDDGRILDADIEMNGADYVFSTGESGAVGTMDVRNTLTHEVGHFIGLDHSANPDTTMYATAREGEVDKRDLHPGDIEGLCTIYPVGTPEESPRPEQNVRGGICSLVAPNQPDHSALLATALFGLVAMVRRRRVRR